MTLPIVLVLFLSIMGAGELHAIDDEVKKRLLGPQRTTQQNYAPPDVTIIAQSCMTCHGYEGALEDSSIPPLVHHSVSQLRDQLIFLRDNPDAATIMHRLLIPFSDDDLTQLASYFGVSDE